MAITQVCRDSASMARNSRVAPYPSSSGIWQSMMTTS